MEQFLLKALPGQLRQNVTNHWLNSLLYSSATFPRVFGDGKLLSDLRKNSGPAVGVAVESESSLKYHQFISPETSSQVFDSWIRERRMWWKKHGYNSTRFEIDTAGRFQSTVHFVDKNKTVTLEKLRLEQPAKKGMAEIITELSDPTVTSRYLLEDATVSVGGVTSLHLHHKLAPYQVSVVSGDQKEMLDAAALLIQYFNKIRISVIPLAIVKNHEEQKAHFAYADRLGVCFNVVLDGAFASGDIYLRSRDTGVCEAVEYARTVQTLAIYLKSADFAPKLPETRALEEDVASSITIEEAKAPRIVRKVVKVKSDVEEKPKKTKKTAKSIEPNEIEPTVEGAVEQPVKKAAPKKNPTKRILALKKKAE